MPPALSDEEASDLELQTSVAKSVSHSKSFQAEPSSDDEPVVTNGNSRGGKTDVEEDEIEDEDLEEDEFIVEAIKSHMVDEDGSLKFQVKWEGYESKKDMTWEPEENLEMSAHLILDEYLESIGGRDKIFSQTEKAAKGKKRGRPASNSVAATAKRARKNGTHPSETAPPATVKAWAPPAGSWEEEIDTIDACEEEANGKLVVYLVWKNGKKTKHDTSVIYKKCPQKMLQFYERHVKIIRDDAKSVQG
ncbi:uncharacterized protein UV8b_00686 [Ustilaginoidea virens]|uniref:Chromo domain-containing protein n=1 Tax=Ustilaginoidea virens TaxID=1159556 RepID=A0A8E5HJ83_USTVR|nr:uncharacterized protein UV8b_00686 [Ustilaginoidea virens]QUC16445.1 hypothetical protein UV8b_00686 [Ustilaginoidea virens]